MGNDEKSSVWKWIIILLLLAGAGAGGFWFFKKKSAVKPEFTTAKVTRGDVTQTVTATGTLKPVVNIEVGSQISGIIQKLYVDFNSEVKSNQIIAQLDASTYRANVSSAEGELANSQASLELAQINAKRAEELFKDKLISQSDFDQAVATLHQAEAQVRIRTASLERARVDFGRCTIYAPVDGIVIDRKVEIGQTVAASMSAPILFQIANDLSRMQINASVAEADVGTVASGQIVEFTVDAFPYRKFHGKVTQVRNSPITVQNVVTYDTIIEVNNDDLKLKPGMTANVSIIIAQREQVLVVPNSVMRFRPPENPATKSGTNAPTQVAALERPAGERSGGGQGGGERRRGGGGGERGGGERGNRPRGEGMRPARMLYVLSVDPEKATPADLKPVSVKLGISDGLQTEVVEGLNEGDVLVSSMTLGGAAAAAPVNNPFGGGGFPRR